MSWVEPFLIDRTNAKLVAGDRDVSSVPPRTVGLWRWLRIVNKTSGMHIFFALLFCVFVLTAPFAIAILVSGFRAARREYRLHRHGRVILGEIQCFGEMIAHGHEQGPEGTIGAPTSWVVPYVKFSFPTPDGRIIASWASIESRKSTDLPTGPGQHLAVLYLDDENYQVL